MIKILDFETVKKHIQSPKLKQKDKIRLLGKNITHKCLKREFDTTQKFYNCIEHEANRFA